MGQAKRRGTFEQRVVQSQERQRAYHERRDRERIEREKKTCEEHQRRVDAGEIPRDRPRRSMMPALIGVAIAASLSRPTRGREWL